MQAIDRAFAVLRALSDRAATSSLADVTRATELPKPTVLRLLTALEEHGAVQQIGGRYSIGPTLATLTHGPAPISAIRELARPLLVELADTLQENAALAVPDDGSVLYIDTATTETAVSVQDWTGERLPFHAAAAGLALMSTWTVDAIEQYAQSGLAAHTEATVTTAEGLQAKTTDVRDHGAVWTLQEFSDDVNGIGAPIHGPDGTAVAAINVYGPDYRFPGDRSATEIVEPLVAACEKISARLR